MPAAVHITGASTSRHITKLSVPTRHTQAGTIAGARAMIRADNLARGTDVARIACADATKLLNLTAVLTDQLAFRPHSLRVTAINTPRRIKHSTTVAKATAVGRSRAVWHITSRAHPPRCTRARVQHTVT